MLSVVTPYTSLGVMSMPSVPTPYTPHLGSFQKCRIVGVVVDLYPEVF